ncbi:MAG: HAD-IA family hydrolase, partial [Chloroflexi bacterium]|nr:HAD-IA family hydrolase [Chloroflexota bacterium]
LADMARTTLAILSNGSPRMLEVGLPADLRERFREVLSVDLVAAYKPSPAVYRLAAQRLELPPARILFVSSNQWDTAGAAAFGFRVALIDRTGAAREELPGQPHLVVYDLAELARAVDMASM